MNRNKGKISREERIERSLQWMTRYEGLFEGYGSYREAVDARPPMDLLVPRGEDDLRLVEKTLAQRGYRTERFDWAPYHLRVHGDKRGGAGSLPEVIFGFAFPQGVVSCLPCLALSPKAGEHVLDVCAAPGGKTVLLARLAGDRARILAGDPNGQRAGLLVQSLSRMGISSAMVIQQDGNCFPAVTNFDAILLDAPCTGEGTFRVPKPRYEVTGELGLARAQGLQKRLLRRSLDLLAPGGRLVYSTCTFSPEENEAVLSELLAEREDISVLPLPEGTPGAPGLSEWRGERFDSRLHHARRVYPQQTGSWGFFLALLQKDATSGHFLSRKLRTDEDPAPPVDEPEAREELERYLAERFSVPAATLEDFIVQRRSRDIWLLARPEGTRPDVQTARLQIVSSGLRALRQTGIGPRITNTLLRCLQDRLRERVIDLPWETLLGMLEKRRIASPLSLPGGQVAIRSFGRVVAAGFLHGETLELEVPKAWR